MYHGNKLRIFVNPRLVSWFERRDGAFCHPERAAANKAHNLLFGRLSDLAAFE